MKSLLFIFLLAIGLTAVPHRAANAAPITNGDAEWKASFGDWGGVNNTTTPTRRTTSTITNGDAEWNASFGSWGGVSNSSTSADPFNGWYGVNNTTSGTTRATSTITNGDAEWKASFGEWTSVASTNRQLSYNANGYPTSTTAALEAKRTSTYFVAPTSGVNVWAPWGFVGLLVAAFAVYRNRTALFS